MLPHHFVWPLAQPLKINYDMLTFLATFQSAGDVVVIVLCAVSLWSGLEFDWSVVFEWLVMLNFVVGVCYPGIPPEVRRLCVHASGVYFSWVRLVRDQTFSSHPSFMLVLSLHIWSKVAVALGLFNGFESATRAFEELLTIYTIRLNVAFARQAGIDPGPFFPDEPPTIEGTAAHAFAAAVRTEVAHADAVTSMLRERDRVFAQREDELAGMALNNAAYRREVKALEFMLEEARGEIARLNGVLDGARCRDDTSATL